MNNKEEKKNDLIIKSYINEHLKDLYASYILGKIYYSISKNNGTYMQTEFARELNTNRQRIDRILRKLKKLGFITYQVSCFNDKTTTKFSIGENDYLYKLWLYDNNIIKVEKKPTEKENTFNGVTIPTKKNNGSQSNLKVSTKKEQPIKLDDANICQSVEDSLKKMKEDDIEEIFGGEEQPTEIQTIDFIPSQIHCTYLEGHIIKKPFTLAELTTSLGMMYFQERIDRIRATDKKTNKTLYSNLKEKIPTFTPSIICSGKTTKDANIIKYNNLICIDIDAQDNEGMTTDKMKDILKHLPYIAYISLSVGGKGVYCIIPISGTIQDFKKHFYAIREDFLKLGLKIDDAPSNIKSQRYISYDLNPYINNKPQIYTKIKEEKEEKQPTYKSQQITYKPLSNITITPITDKEKLDFLMIARECKNNGILLTENHKETLNLCMCMLSNFPQNEAYKYCKIFRKQRNGFDEDKLKDTFNMAKQYVASGNKKGIKWFFKLANIKKKKYQERQTRAQYSIPQYEEEVPF